MRSLSQYGCTRVEAGYGGDGSWRYDNDIGALMHTQEFMTVVRSIVGRQSVSGFGPPIQFSSLVEMESYVAGYCSAIQVREFREALLYRDLQAAGAPLPARTGVAWWMPLDDEHLEALFQHFDQIGAFNEFSIAEGGRYASFFKRELWEIFRREGKVYQLVLGPEDHDPGNWFAFSRSLRRVSNIGR